MRIVMAQRKNKRTKQVNFFGPRYITQFPKELSHERTMKEVSFLKKRLGLRPGMRVLDLGCGSGRHSVEIAKLGCAVTGLDKTPFLLSEAKRAAKAAGVSVRFVRGDMRKMKFRNKFDAVASFFTSFGYSDDERDHSRAMERVAAALKKKGKFFIDVSNRDYLVSHFSRRDRRVHEDGSVTLHERAFDPVRSVKTNYQIHVGKGGRRERTQVSVRMFAPHEIVRLCEDAGLKFLELWGDYGPFELAGRGFIVIAQK